MTNVDSQQIPRGCCESDGCDCKEFVKGGDNPKCTGCKHAPVKHKALVKVPTTSAPVVQQEAGATPNAVPPLIQPAPAAPTSQHQLPYQNQSMPFNMQPQSTDPSNHGYHMNMFPNMYAPDQQQHQQQQQFVLPAGQVFCRNCGCWYPEQSGACVVCNPRGTCNICKANVVFMDVSMGPGLQVFDYCSPECRNKDLPRLDKEAGILQSS